MAGKSQPELGEMVSALKREALYHCEVVWDSSKPYDMTPREFLEFARQDLADDSERGRVNSLSNAKRALECRIDEVIYQWNLRPFAKQGGHWKPLPYKLKVLSTLGVFAPPVLSEYITKRRNFLEHQYTRPASDDVKHVVDIVGLFLEASEQHIKSGRVGAIHVRCLETVIDEEMPIERAGRPGTARCVYVSVYEARFDRTRGTVALTYFSAGALRRKRRGIPVETLLEPEYERKAVIPVIDCREEDVRELVNLARKKADIEH